MAGLSRDGEHYFYDNPLESDGSHQRWEWHFCPCCTMNVARLTASVSGYFYSTSADALSVHLYGGTEAKLDVAGTTVQIKETSNYPWSGTIAIRIDPKMAVEFALKLRIPAWAKDAKAAVNGQRFRVADHMNKGYLKIRRIWTRRDTVELELPMPVERVYAHPAVREDSGKVALRRGPLVYCVEQADNGELPLDRLRLPRQTSVDAVDRPDLFGGIVTLSARAKCATDDGWTGQLYRSEPLRNDDVTLTAIPYFLWANRGSNAMRVWLQEG